MSVPRVIFKSLVANIPITESRSYTTASLGPGASLFSENFNIQTAAFFNVIGTANVLESERIAGGHVLYIASLVQPSGGTYELRILGTMFPGGINRTIVTIPGTPGQAQVVRNPDLGACWTVRVQLVNTGATTYTNVEFAVAVRGQ